MFFFLKGNKGKRMLLLLFGKIKNNENRKENENLIIFIRIDDLFFKLSCLKLF